MRALKGDELADFIPAAQIRRPLARAPAAVDEVEVVRASSPTAPTK